MCALLIQTGGHLGRDKTYDKVATKFFWRNMYEEITSYVQRCHVCQTVNDKFCKPSAQLHPIEVDPGFWMKVLLYIILRASLLNDLHYTSHLILTDRN